MPRQITASILYSHLTCPQRVATEVFKDPPRQHPVSPLVQLLWQRRTLCETDAITRLGGPFRDP